MGQAPVGRRLGPAAVCCAIFASTKEALSTNWRPAQSRALALARQPVSPRILQMLKVMGQTQDEMRWNDNPRIVLELYSLRLTSRLSTRERCCGGSSISKAEPEKRGTAGAGALQKNCHPVTSEAGSAVRSAVRLPTVPFPRFPGSPIRQRLRQL